jgi:hypothetical protein
MDALIVDTELELPFDSFEGKDLALWGEEEYARIGDPAKGESKGRGRTDRQARQMGTCIGWTGTHTHRAGEPARPRISVENFGCRVLGFMLCFVVQSAGDSIEVTQTDRPPSGWMDGWPRQSHVGRRGICCRLLHRQADRRKYSCRL